MLGTNKVYSHSLTIPKFQDFLQRERYGCAQLQNFAAGLELIGQKVRINPLVVSLMFKTRYFSLSFCCLKQFDN